MSMSLTTPDKTIALDGFTVRERVYFSISGILSMGTNKYVVTNAFKEVVRKIERGTSLVIRGPKGVGKSMAICALAALCKNKQYPCILCALQSVNSPHFTEYVKEVYKYLGKRFQSRDGESNQSLMERVLGELDTALFLLDLSSLSEVSSPSRQYLMSVLSIAMNRNSVSVISHSSRSGNFIPINSLRRLLSDIDIMTSVEFSPFNESEANAFFSLYQTQYPFVVSVSCLKELTNYNPLLLYKCANKDYPVDGMNLTKLAVERIVRATVSAIADSITDRRHFRWVMNGLPQTIEMFYYASISEPLCITRLEEYLKTWVAVERITYISQQNHDNFTLSVNFPTIWPHLMEILQEASETREDSSSHCTDIINGYCFEANVCKQITKLNIEYIVGDENRSVSTFDILVHASQPAGAPLTKMVKGVLYHLRMKHPVIDAVGLLTDARNTDWLVMLQISLAPYRKHSSKAQNLFEKVKAPELTCTDTAGCSILTYYRMLAADTIASGSGGASTEAGSGNSSTQHSPSTMYIYISPENVGSPEDLKESGISAKTKELYLGVVLKNSDTHYFIERQVAQVKR